VSVASVELARAVVESAWVATAPLYGAFAEATVDAARAHLSAHEPAVLAGVLREQGADESYVRAALADAAAARAGLEAGVRSARLVAALPRALVGIAERRATLTAALQARVAAGEDAGELTGSARLVRTLLDAVGNKAADADAADERRRYTATAHETTMAALQCEQLFAPNIGFVMSALPDDAAE
jgi:hypothetical protein